MSQGHKVSADQGDEQASPAAVGVAADPLAPPVEPAAAAQPRWLPWAVSAGLVLLTVAMHWPYQPLGHALDDWDHLYYLAQYQEGETSLDDYLLMPYNEHLIPAWRAWYLASWKAFGLRPTGWHVAISVVHGFGAACLFLFLRAHLPFIAALAAGAVWAVTGNAGWDNPLCWIPASHLTFGMAWLLAAMACLTRYRDAGWLWPTLMALSMVMAVLSMTAMLVLLPMLAAQWCLLERRGDERWRPREPWLEAWLLPFLFGVGLTTAAYFGVFGGTQLNPAGSDVVVGVTRALVGWSLSLKFFIFPFGTRVPENLFPYMLGGLALLLVATIVSAGHRRLIAVFVAPLAVYTLLVHVARSNLVEDFALLSGRYLYLPTLAWCGVLACMLAARWDHATARGRKVLLAALGIIALALVLHQSRAVAQTVRDFRTKTRLSRLWVSGSADVWSTAGRDASADGAPLRVPNLVWLCLPANFSLSQFETVVVGRQLPGLTIVPAQKWTSEDYDRALAYLAHSNHPARFTIQEALAYERRVATVLLELDRLAERKNAKLYVPDFALAIPLPVFHGGGVLHPPAGPDDPEYQTIEMDIRLSLLARRLFGGGLPHLQFVELRQMNAVDRRDTIRALRAVDEPLASQWADDLQATLPAAP